MNLSTRLQNRRFTRLTDGFSKKLDNHIHALALYFAFYDFCRIHNSLKLTPAMAAGITDRLWSLEILLIRLMTRPLYLSHGDHTKEGLNEKAPALPGLPLT